MPMFNPPHPGEGIRDIIHASGLTIVAAAQALGVNRQTLSNLINCHAGVSPEMALRLEAVFGGTADTWLDMQTAHDLWRVRAKEKEIKKGLKSLIPA